MSRRPSLRVSQSHPPSRRRSDADVKPLFVFFPCVCWKVHGEIWGTTSSLLLIPSPTRCHRWSKSSIQVGTDEGGSSEWEYWSWFRWFLPTEGGSETESTVDSEFGRGDILATTSSESFFSYKPRYLVLLRLHRLFSKLKVSLISCVLLQRSQRCRGGELREPPGAAAGGRAQSGGAAEAQTGTRQRVHGEAAAAVSAMIWAVF